MSDFNISVKSYIKESHLPMIQNKAFAWNINLFCSAEVVYIGSATNYKKVLWGKENYKECFASLLIKSFTDDLFYNCIFYHCYHLSYMYFWWYEMLYKVFNKQI